MTVKPIEIESTTGVPSSAQVSSFWVENAAARRPGGHGHPPITLALAAVLALTIAMWAGGTKPERPLTSFGVIETTQVQTTAASLVNPVFGCLPGGF